jgi:hypothetical protein
MYFASMTILFSTNDDFYSGVETEETEFQEFAICEKRIGGPWNLS